MSYELEAFIGKKEDLIVVSNSYKVARLVTLSQNIVMIPMVPQLFYEITIEFFYEPTRKINWR